MPPVPRRPSTPSLSTDPGVACVGTRLGLSCLIDGVWENFDRENSPISAWVQSVDVCDDGTVVAITLDGIATYADGRWTDIPAEFSVSGPSAVACGPEAIWAGFFGWIGSLQDGTWTFWNTEEVLGQTEFVKSVKDIAVAPDGSAWVVTGSSIARFDGEWTAWEDNAGFDVSLSPTAIGVDTAADGSYTVHAAAGFRGIANFVNGEWSLQETGLNGASDLAANDGIVLIPAFRAGVTSYQGVAETPFTSADGLSSDTVRGTAIDSAGQQWLATSYGLTVVTGGDIRTYRVDNSGLLENDAYAVAVSGAGPDLPADDPQEWGGLAGIVLDDTGTPHVGIAVEVCVEEQRDDFDGETPCSTHPFMAGAVTDGDRTLRDPRTAGRALHDQHGDRQRLDVLRRRLGLGPLHRSGRQRRRAGRVHPHGLTSTPEPRSHWSAAADPAWTRAACTQAPVATVSSSSGMRIVAPWRSATTARYAGLWAPPPMRWSLPVVEAPAAARASSPCRRPRTTPSSRGPCEVGPVSAVAETFEGPRGFGQVGGALAVEVGGERHAVRSGRCREGEAGELVAVGGQPSGDGLGDLGRVEGAHQREVAAGGIAEPGNRPAGVVRRRRRHGVDRSRRTERHRRISGLEAETERRRHVVAGARADGDPDRKPQCLGGRRPRAVRPSPGGRAPSAGSRPSHRDLRRAREARRSTPLCVDRTIRRRTHHPGRSPPHG